MKKLRRDLGISQKTLGVAMGLPEDVAGVRINRYERAVHDCDTETAQKMAKALGVSLAYLYAETDELAELIKEFTSLSSGEQKEILDAIRGKTLK
ncbi:helix-turn-helix transcriptional regulator [Stenotrophomonas maltophilia]|uniref:helix-turn-helix domain-containing protein n=1 Tax=Stenotrophomonas maltophilia TaxID=40324 RepID=UPI002E75DA3F|nr:helix-turn-helix transcriptional regulator [Stenotrophomonas maltophilia]